MLEIDGDLLEHEHFAQEGGVGKAGAGRGDEVIGVFDNDRVLALQHELVSRFARGLAAAEEHDLVAVVLIAGEQLFKRDRLIEAGHGELLRHGAGADDDLVILAGERVDRVDLGVEVDLDAGLLQLTVVPLEQLLVRFLEGHGGGIVVHAAELVALFVDDRGMAALLEDKGAFHAADTAADDGDLLGVLRRDDLILVVLHRGRGQRAAGQMQRIVHRLHVGCALGAVEVEAGVVAVDAGLDLLLAVLKELVDPFGIDEVLTADAHRVDAALGDLLGSELGLHLTGADDRLGGEVLDVLDIRNVAVGRHIDRRMRPVPGVVGAVIAVEHVVAGVLEILDGLFRLGHIAAELNKLLAGDGALAEALRLGDDGVAQRHGEVLAAQLLDLLHDLNGKAVAVLERSAVLVGTVVHVGNGKLVKEVALVNGVDLHTVNAGIHKHLRGLAEGFDHFMDLFLCQRAGLDLRIPAVGGL